MTREPAHYREALEAVRAIHREWWGNESSALVLEAEDRRVAFNAALLLDRAPRGGVVCDVGGGWGVLSAACALLGRQAILVEDFADYVYDDATHNRFKLAKHYGVSVVRRDVAMDGIDFAPASLDAVSCFDSIEHWHQTPRPFLQQAVRALRPGGMLAISLPNGVDVFRRIMVPLGKGKWSPFNEWYEEPKFRSHVREIDVEDMQRIATDLHLDDARVFGRNWSQLSHPSGIVRRIGAIADPMLQWRPSLCLTLYLVGSTPAAPSH